MKIFAINPSRESFNYIIRCAARANKVKEAE